jgi:hypothetical protein
MALYNPDKPDRPVNSPKAVYQIEPAALALLRTFGTPAWHDGLTAYLAERETLVARYAKEREQNRIPVEIAPGKKITLSPGEHSELIRAIIEDFAPRFAPGSVLVYAGDTGDKWGYFDAALLAKLGVDVDSHGKMPDVVLHYTAKNWLLLVESVTSHGPVDGKRHAELAKLFAGSTAGLVYVTAFPNRAIMGRYLGEIAWETEVWVADAPSHLIHFNGERFLGPYQLIRDCGCKAGLALNPATPLDCLRYVMDKLDMILLMSVNPGFGGQSFISGTLHKLREVRRLIDDSGYPIRLEVDGGVKLDNIRQIAEAGADTFVAGSAIFNTPDYRATLAAFRAELAQANGGPHV